MHAFKNELWNGEVAPSDPQTELEALASAEERPLRELADHARARLRLLRLSPRDALAIVSDARHFVEWAATVFGLHKLWALQERHARSWARHLREDGLPREAIRVKIDSLVRIGLLQSARVEHILSALDRS
jgi:hypothetical protein